MSVQPTAKVAAQVVPGGDLDVSAEDGGIHGASVKEAAAGVRGPADKCAAEPRVYARAPRRSIPA